MDLYHIWCNLKPGASDVEFHATVNQSVCDLTFALYRDFPDPHRERGNEQF